MNSNRRRVRSLDKMAELGARCWAFLLSLRGRIAQLHFYLYVFNIYHLVRRDWRHKYERRPSNCRNATPTAGHGAASSAAMSRRLEPERDKLGDWFTKMPRLYVALRYFTTFYMIYVVVKCSAPDQLHQLVDLLGLSKPAHCYVLGRFKIHQRINNQVAMIYAALHLVWRAIMFFCMGRRKVANNTIYFLMLDERDLDDYYKLLADRQFIEAKRRRRSNGSSSNWAHRAIYAGHYDKTRLLQDVMSYKITNANGTTTLHLRPNRTREASRRLATFTAQVTVWSWALYSPIAVSVTTAVVSYLVTNERYQRDYLECDPVLDQLAREGKLAEWWRHPFRHQVLANAVDILENVILWLESGLVTACFIGSTLVFNYDNLVYWNHLKGKIDALLELARDSSPMSEGGRAQWERLIRGLQTELADFMDQWAQSNRILTDLHSMTLSVWFILFAVFNHNVMAQQRTGFPIELSLVLLLVFAVASSCWLILVVLNRRCIGAYSSLCSLMALDKSSRKRKFGRILESFSAQRVCYTVYRTYPITLATYITLCGYSFSIFFLLASTSNRK